jgi:phage shock protein A
MGGTLERHEDDMLAYQDMIETRERAYAERLPRADALLNSGAVDKLQAREVALDNQLRAIEAQHNVAALGTEEERAQWARIQRIEAGLAGAPDTPENADLRTRLALVKGVLFFRLNDAYGARLWQEHRELKDLNLALHETQSRWIRVERARKNVPVNTGEFATRVNALKGRIDTLETRLVAAEQKQRDYLARVAVQELERQKDRLATYQIQARFELGTMYDRAARQEAARPVKPAAPVQKGAEDDAGAAPTEPPQ